MISTAGLERVVVEAGRVVVVRQRKHPPFRAPTPWRLVPLAPETWAAWSARARGESAGPKST